MVWLKPPSLQLSGPQYMLLSALGFALMGVTVKTAGQLGIPLLQIIAVRAVISVVLSLADIHRAGVHPLGEHRGLLLARGLVGFLSLTCVFYALLNLPFAEATVLQYLHPVFTAALAWLLLREIPGGATLLCIGLSLLGLIVMVLPALTSTTVPLDGWAVAAGLAGAFGSGLAYTIVRKLATVKEHPSVIVFYFPLVCLPAATLWGWSDFVWPGLAGWAVLLGVGVFTQLGQVALTLAMRVDSASKAASFSYLQIVFAAMLGVVVFGEHPPVTTLVGGGFILVASLSNWLLHRRAAARA